jgi:hypothetical protein
LAEKRFRRRKGKAKLGLYLSVQLVVLVERPFFWRTRVDRVDLWRLTDIENGNFCAGGVPFKTYQHSGSGWAAPNDRNFHQKLSNRGGTAKSA